ncbi:MAG: hypothetical protein ACLQT7_06865 [Candidatus Dormibacteria bacterium]
MIHLDFLIDSWQDPYMSMNPWITCQTAGARIDDLRRAATLDRLARDARSPERQRMGHPAAAGRLAARDPRG